MTALALSCVIFLFVLGGIFIGTAFRRASLTPKADITNQHADVMRVETEPSKDAFAPKGLVRFPWH